jgi:hypothetical protein
MNQMRTDMVPCVVYLLKTFDLLLFPERASAILRECKILDEPHAVDNVHLGIRAGADPNQDPRLRTGVGWLLLKYLSLIVGVGRMLLESVVDDFFIHLLVALGYNDGDLVILSVKHKRAARSVLRLVATASCCCCHVAAAV